MYRPTASRAELRDRSAFVFGPERRHSPVVCRIRVTPHDSPLAINVDGGLVPI